MSDVVGARAPGWVRIFGGLGLLWNAVGVYYYLGRVGVVAGDAASAGMQSSSTLFTAVFATSVFAGLLGCVGLLMLKSWSRLLLVLSLLAVLAQDYAVLSAGVPQGSALVMTLVVNLIAFLLAWVSHVGVQRGWLN